MSRSILAVIGLCAIVSLTIMGLWSYDVYQNRKHVVTIETPVPLFDGTGK